MAKVRVPRTPKKAFNRARRPSSLLLGQIEHLEWAVLPASQRKPGQLPAKKVRSEAQAAERVAQLTKMLHEAAAADAAARAAGAAPAPRAALPVVLPPLPRAAARRKPRASARPRKAARTPTPGARHRRPER